MTVVIFHNPKCGTSRNALALLCERGVERTMKPYWPPPSPSRS
ncbi:MAG: hypothetical protein ACK4MY_02305 [Brevundimonas sp.]